MLFSLDLMTFCKYLTVKLIFFFVPCKGGVTAIVKTNLNLKESNIGANKVLHFGLN